jgi:hypothetical protein
MIRALLTSALVATIALAGLAGTTLAGASENGNGYSFEIYEEWCFDDLGTWLCMDIKGRVTYANKDNGDQIGTAQVSSRFWIVENGVVTSGSVDHSVFQTRFVDGTALDELVITQTRFLEPGQQCVAHVLLKIENGEVVVGQDSYSCN